MTDDIQNDFEYISKMKHKNERLAWKRKYDKLQRIISEKIEPIQERFMALQEERQIVLSEIDELRAIMVKECVHPKDMLVHKGTHVLCKFCNVNLSLPTLFEELEIDSGD